MFSLHRGETFSPRSWSFCINAWSKYLRAAFQNRSGRPRAQIRVYSFRFLYRVTCIRLRNEPVLGCDERCTPCFTDQFSLRRDFRRIWELLQLVVSPGIGPVQKLQQCLQRLVATTCCEKVSCTGSDPACPCVCGELERDSAAL